MLSTLFVHTATVETFLGSGPTGDVYAAPVDVQGYLDDGIVRVQGSTSEQLVQKATFYAAVADAPKFALESRVTVNGRACQVSALRVRDAGAQFGPVAHVEVDLT